MGTVAVALSGIIVGWLLGFGAQLWRDRMEARDAANLVVLELHSNMTKLKMRSQENVWAGPDDYILNDVAWRSHRMAVLRIVPYETLQALSEAYEAVEAANASVRIINKIRKIDRETNEFRRKAGESTVERDEQRLLGGVDAQIAAMAGGILSLLPIVELSGAATLLPLGVRRRIVARREAKRAALTT